MEFLDGVIFLPLAYCFRYSRGEQASLPTHFDAVLVQALAARMGRKRRRRKKTMIVRRTGQMRVGTRPTGLSALSPLTSPKIIE